ncbi:MAG: nucleoside 2-deoxyribosyltransferase domain-containing protein [bacterium]|nr:nucleoside 2-deoxyribosyltransferase domain-containing protein [bacterium]
MYIVYTGEEPPESFSQAIFLAGPTPRTNKVASWRPKALRILKKRGFGGVVFVPEWRDGTHARAYEKEEICAWEHRMLHMADCILFWVPRNLKNLPGFTTNIEFGLFEHCAKSVFGAPRNAPKNDYLRFVAKTHSIPACRTLPATIDVALARVTPGELRSGGERHIPLHVWRHPAFQNWYETQKNAGNRLDGARVEWLSRVRNKPEKFFCFAIHPNVYITSENRNKLNDPVIFRLDISSVILYKRAPDISDTKVVLVKEFRLAGATKDGFIWELPGGSSPFLSDPLQIAIEEVHEEVGLHLEPDRLKQNCTRQLAGTILAHKAHLFSAELTNEELAWLETQKGIPHGADLDNPTGERAYTEIKTLGEILSENLVDWSNVGMICQALQEIS